MFVIDLIVIGIIPLEVILSFSKNQAADNKNQDNLRSYGHFNFYYILNEIDLIFYISDAINGIVLFFAILSLGVFI